MKLNWSTVFLCLLLLSFVRCHKIKEVAVRERESISSFVNQPREVSIPFHKCFKVQTELQANKKYLQFQPTRIVLQLLKSYSLKNEGSKISVVDELRSAITYKHGHLLVFPDYLMVFFAPNVIMIVEENPTGFRVKHRYYLQNLERFDKFKMYKLGTKALLVVYNKKKAYLLNQLDYQDYQLPEPSTIVHLQPINPDQFYAAQFTKGLSHYRLDHPNKQIQMVRHFTAENIGLSKGQFRYVVDVSLNFYEKDKIVLVLDAEIGLIQLNLTEISSPLNSKIVVNHKMCESFDAIELNHLVLLCQNQGHSTILQAFREYDRRTKQYHYRKATPIFQANYLNDLHVAQNYYLAYSYKNIHTFWNTFKNRLPETLETQNQIVLPGLQTFAFKRETNSQNILYTIEAGQLYKYSLVEKPASLKIVSDQAINKEFKLFFYGSCEDLENKVEQKGKSDAVEACRLTRSIALKVSEEEYPREEDFGVSASIVAILVTVFLLVIWICLKKYKGLQREARKVLQNYKNKRARATRSI